MRKEQPKAFIVPVEPLILVVRGRRVILDADLATLYGITTKRLNEQVKRNHARFPEDFIFSITQEEKTELVANCDRFRNLKHSTVLPNAFTEHGAVMAASVLNTPLAVETSVFVVRAFVRLREVLAGHRELVEKLVRLEEKVATHDDSIRSIVKAIRDLMQPKEKTPRRRIGFGATSKKQE